MTLSHLTLTDFRSYPEAQLEPGPGFVLLTGDNGAGKTNILEAVSLLTPGRGLRGVALGQMARLGGEGSFAVAATLSPLPPAGGAGGGPLRNQPLPQQEHALPPAPSRSREGEVSIGTGTLATAPERRQVRINSAPASVNALSEWLSVLWLTPAMDRLFSGTTGDRRRFLDRLVLALEPSHAHHAARYEAAMRARNKLLAEPDGADPDWLTALETGMAEHGAAVSDARHRTVAALGEARADTSDDAFATAVIALDGWSDRDLARDLRDSRGRDAAAGRATVGPHRQDLSVTHAGKNMPAARCSTGEQKALLLGLVLAHAELVASRRRTPLILLLDEVAAHLDARRREALFGRLAGRGQTWMTGTESGLFAGIGNASRFQVTEGQALPF